MACNSSFVALSIFPQASCCQVLLLFQVHSINVLQPFIKAALSEFFHGNLKPGQLRYKLA